MGLPQHDPRLAVEQSQPAELDEIERAIMQISWLSQRQFMQLLDEERFHLTLPQFHTLLHLHQMAGACKMSDLAEATHQSAASLTGVVDRLLEKLLVERTRDVRDRRQVMVIVTSRGSQLIAEIKQARHDQMQAALSHLNVQDIDLLLGLLDSVLAGMVRIVERVETGNWA